MEIKKSRPSLTIYLNEDDIKSNLNTLSLSLCQLVIKEYHTTDYCTVDIEYSSESEYQAIPIIRNVKYVNKDRYSMFVLEDTLCNFDPNRLEAVLHYFRDIILDKNAYKLDEWGI